MKRKKDKKCQNWVKLKKNKKKTNSNWRQINWITHKEDQ